MPIPKQRLDERQERSTEDWAVVVPFLLMLLVFLLAPMLYDLFQLR